MRALLPCWLAGLGAASSGSCPDKILPGYSVFAGGTVAAYANVSGGQSACCALCHGAYRDECLGATLP